MSGIIHFKFKSSTSYDSVGFQGAFISVSELKVLIAEKKGLSKDATSELLLSDPRIQVDYNDDTAVIPKSSSVLVRRVPNLPPAQLTFQQAGTSASGPTGGSEPASNSTPANPPGPSGNGGGEDEFGGDLYTEQRDEDSALTQLLNQQGKVWQDEINESSVRGRGRGRGWGFGRGRDSGRGFGRGRGREAEPIVLPKGYICYRCGQQGHHISDCPTNLDPDFKRIRPAVGVPSVLLAKDKEGGLLLPDGSLGTLQPNEKAFMNEIKGMPGASAAASEPPKPAENPSTGGEAGALVVYNGGEGSGAEPTLAGSGELGGPPLGPPGGLLLPPVGAAMPGWDLAAGALPFLPGMALPGVATPGAPMSREEFERMQADFRRKQERGRRSKSRSRSPSRHRRRSRDSRSPQRRDSPRRSYKSRRHRSRDRSPSQDRGYRRPYFPPRRGRSPSPGFIQLRKDAPPPRRLREGHGQDARRRVSVSPPRQRARRASPQPPPARWQPDGTTLDQPTAAEVASAAAADEPVQGQPEDPLDAKWDPKERTDPFPLATGKMRSDFSVPELMGDPAASFSMGPEVPGEPRSLAVPRKVTSAGLGTPRSRLQKATGKRKAEDSRPIPPTAERPPKAHADADASAPSRGSTLPGKKEDTQPDVDSDQERFKRASVLPKTFKIPVEESYRDRKHKKSKKSKSREKEKQPSSTLPAKSVTVPEVSSHDTDAEQQAGNGLAHIAAYSSGGPDSEASRGVARPPLHRRKAGTDALVVPAEAPSYRPAESDAAEHPSQDVDTAGLASGRRQQAPLFLKAMTEAAGGEKPKHSSRPWEGSTREKLVALIRDPAGEDFLTKGAGGEQEAAGSRGKEKKRKEHKEHKSKHKSKKKHKEKRSRHDSPS